MLVKNYEDNLRAFVLIFRFLRGVHSSFANLIVILVQK